MITATDISLSVPMLNGVGISIRPGQITGIIGPNGAGKTTLLKILAGLIKPDSGTILLDDMLLTELTNSQRALAIAYLEQHSFVHWPLSVRQLIQLGRYPHRLNPNNSPALDNQAVENVIEEVGIYELIDRQFNTLSGGERARVIIARALAVEAAYLLVDEPIASLDLNYQIEVMNILAKQAKRNTAVCVILHDLNLAAAYCDSLYLLDKGNLVSQGTVEDVLTQATIQSVFGINVTVSSRDGQIDIQPVYNN